jgi:hypothetical protein
MRIAAVKPVFHSLLNTNWHLLVAGLLEDELLEVEVAGAELLVTTELLVLVATLELVRDDEVAGMLELVATDELLAVPTIP